MTAVVRVGTAEGPGGGLVAFRVEGEGGRALAACGGLGIPHPFWRALAAQVSLRGDTFVTWDYRGQGQSPAAGHPESMTVASCAGDLWAVLDAVPAQRAVLLGHSAGAHVIVEAYRQKPDRVLGLVPVLGDGSVPPALGPVLRVLVEVGAANPEPARRALRAALLAPGACEAMRALGILPPDGGDRESHLQRLLGLDLRGWFALARDLLSRDATRLLADVRAPVMRLDAAQLEQPELVALKLEKFLEQVEPT